MLSSREDPSVPLLKYHKNINKDEEIRLKVPIYNGYNTQSKTIQTEIVTNSVFSVWLLFLKSTTKIAFSVIAKDKTNGKKVFIYFYSEDKELFFFFLFFFFSFLKCFYSLHFFTSVCVFLVSQFFTAFIVLSSTFIKTISWCHISTAELVQSFPYLFRNKKSNFINKILNILRTFLFQVFLQLIQISFFFIFT